MNQFVIVVILLSSAFLITGCMQEYNNEPVLPPSRESKILSTAVKITSADDQYSPCSHTSEFSTPVPLSGPVNTAGAEESPFITSDGAALYFFFTPDVTIPAEKQVLDGVTGFYVSYSKNEGLDGT